MLGSFGNWLILGNQYPVDSSLKNKIVHIFLQQVLNKTYIHSSENGLSRNTKLRQLRSN